MGKKYTIKEVKKIFEEGGCELLEEEYKNNNTKMRYVCECGRTDEINLGNFKKGQRCKKCAGEKRAIAKKHSYKYVYNYFEEHGCELLEEEYKNNNTKMKYRCNCMRVSEITFADFCQGKRCSLCAMDKRKLKLKLSYKEVYKYFLEQNCELIEKEYKNNQTPMEYRCSCGKVSKITFGNFQQGQKCWECAIKKRAEKRIKYTLEEIKKIFKNEGCELLEKEYSSCTMKMRYICSCGREAKISLLKFEKGQRCKKCGIEKISGKNNPNYNHNLTDEERLIRRQYPEYNDWTKDIYKKNDYICQKCFQKGGPLNAHHIESYDINIDLRLDINNGITFCKDCHKEFHKKYGYGKNNREQLNEFLENNLIKV